MTRKVRAAALAAVSMALSVGVMAQQPAAIERIKISDNEASCAQLFAESSQMDKVSADAKAAQEKSGNTALAAGAANQAAEVVGRTGEFFGAFGSVLGGIVGQAATQTAATATQQSAQQSAQQSVARGRQAQARKEHVTALFLSKGCKASDLAQPGKTLSGEEMRAGTMMKDGATLAARPHQLKFGRLLPHGLLELRPSSLKLSQSLVQGAHFLLDVTQLCLVLAARQMICAKLLSDVLLKLTPQDPEIWISPYRAFSVFKFAGSNALHNEVPVHSIFLLGRCVAEGCPFTVPFAIFRHISSL